MAAADNPYFISPANPLQALMSGVQGYDAAQKNTKENQMQEGRKAAMGALQTGGDLRGPLAQLIGIGDVQGAKAISDYAQNEATAKHQAGMLAETSSHNRVTEGIQREELNKPMAVPVGSELVTRQGQPIYGDKSSISLDAPTIDAMAKQAISGDTSVFQNLGRGVQGAQNVVAVRKRIAELNSGQGETGTEQASRNAEFGGVKAGFRTASTRGANIEMASTEFEKILPIVEEASKAVNRTNYPDLNKIILAYERKTGDPNVVKFGQGINTLINLYARAISPSGVATVSDKDHARDILTASWSQGQFSAATGMMKQEIDAAKASPEAVRDEMRKRFLGGVPGKPAGVTPPADRNFQTQPTDKDQSKIPAPPPGFIPNQ